MPRIRVLQSPEIQILIGTLASLLLSFTAVLLRGTLRGDISVTVVLLFLFSFLFSYITPAAVLTLALYRAFQKRQSRRERLRLIVLSYFSMIVVFTGAYFSMASVGDYDSAVDHYFYYLSAGQDLATARIQRVNPYPADRLRAFSGIDERLWSTVDDYIPRGIYQGLDDIERHRAQWAARLAFAGVVRFKQASIQSVVLDSLHLSVMTITTVGYGNIAPRTWYAKLATDLEALTGIVLFVVALGMAFAERLVADTGRNREDW